MDVGPKYLRNKSQINVKILGHTFSLCYIIFYKIILWFYQAYNCEFQQYRKARTILLRHYSRIILIFRSTYLFQRNHFAYYFSFLQSLFTGTSYQTLQTFCSTFRPDLRWDRQWCGHSLINPKTFALNWCEMLMLFCSMYVIYFSLKC